MKRVYWLAFLACNVIAYEKTIQKNSGSCSVTLTNGYETYTRHYNSQLFNSQTTDIYIDSTPGKEICFTAFDENNFMRVQVVGEGRNLLGSQSIYTKEQNPELFKKMEKKLHYFLQEDLRCD